MACLPSSNPHHLLSSAFQQSLLPPPFANLCNNKMETGGRRRDQFELLQELHAKLEKLEEETQAMNQTIRRCAEERAKLMDEITKQFHRIRKSSSLSNDGERKKLNLQTFRALISIIKQLDDH